MTRRTEVELVTNGGGDVMAADNGASICHKGSQLGVRRIGGRRRNYGSLPPGCSRICERFPRRLPIRRQRGRRRRGRIS